MPNITLSKTEILFLREDIKNKYQSNGNKLYDKRSAVQYAPLKNDIIEVCKISGTVVSDEQLMRLFAPNTIDATALAENMCLQFKDNFVESCYRYAYDKSLAEYRTAHPNIQEVETKLHQLETEQTQMLAQIETLKKELRLNRLWYQPPPLVEEAELKKELAFVETAQFQERIQLLIRALLRGHQKFVKEGLVNELYPRLIWYKNLEDEAIQSILYKTQSGDHFRTDLVTFTGFDCAENKADKDSSSDNLSMVHTIFSGFAKTILKEPFNAKIHDATYLNQLLNIPSELYTAVILYIGLQQPNKAEGMVRYPAFREDMDRINGFVLGQRQWWRDATNEDRRQSFSWKINPNDKEIPAFYMGLSKPYETIRTHEPNQRCLWVEVPIAPPATMLIGIDLLKND
jgi:hypothetical protein